jgi:hypothetical protein
VFSQLSNLASTVLNGSIPEFSPFMLMLMVFGGIAGGMIVSRIITVFTNYFLGNNKRKRR